MMSSELRRHCNHFLNNNHATSSHKSPYSLVLNVHAQDAIKNDGSGGCAHINRDERDSAQDNIGIAQNDGRSSQEVGDVVVRVNVDGV